MKRRAFLQSSLAHAIAVSATLAEFSHAAPAAGAPREHYELRTYTLRPGKKPVLDAYLSKALIPALRRAGAGPVGVFSEGAGANVKAVRVLIVFKSADEAAALGKRLAADAEHAKAAAAYIAAQKSDPAHEPVEISTLGAIEGFPRIAKPDTSKPRLLNLRIYESPGERASAKKIEMFNKHELAIFQRVGLTPVFFAGALSGPRMPNLTYMLVFPDDAARTAAWKRFGGDDEWKKLKAIPEYADKELITRITNMVLTPEPYSEI